MDQGLGGDLDTGAPRGRGTWKVVGRVLNIALMVVSFGGLAWLIAAEHAELGRAILGMGKAKAGLIVAAVFCERFSILSFARQRSLLIQAGGQRLKWWEELKITFAANALSVTVPLAGAGLATAFTYQEFDRHHIRHSAAAFALIVSGVLSSISLAIVLAAGALVSGTPFAALLGLAGAVPVVAGIAFATLAWRVPACRRVLERASIGCVRTTQRVRRKSGKTPEAVVADVFRQLASLRLSRMTWAAVVGLSFANWLADACCLFLAIRAAGLHVPTHDLLLVWSAGIAAASIGFTPGGVGVVEAALIAALASVGLPTADSAVAVMIYRMISLWLVIMIGWVCFIIIKSRRAKADAVAEQDTSLPSLRDNA